MCRFYKEYLGRPYCVYSSVLLVCFPWLVCEPPEGRNSLLLPEAPTARIMQVSRTDQVSPQVLLFSKTLSPFRAQNHFLAPL